MKRIIVLFILSALFVGISFGDIQIRAGRFVPSDSYFDQIYGRGWMYGGDLFLKFANNIDLWIGIGYLHSAGKLTYTQEDTKLTLIPITVGLKYSFLKGKRISPYISAGIGYVFFSESNVIDDVSSGALGLDTRGGAVIQLGAGFGLDLYAGYSYCKMHPADCEFNSGGIFAGLGLNYSFRGKRDFPLKP